ncbi:MAG TPA: Ig domain-containing protein [Aeromicrobium sp.]|nr:Ig domain-containing protein [Aeromicrobium sp.]
MDFMRKCYAAGLSALFLGSISLGLGATSATAATGQFEDQPASAPIVVDADTVNRTIPVDLDGQISDINVTLNFHKVGDWCSNPSGFLSWNNEIKFDLVSPAGTRVTLIQSGHLTDDPDEADPNITYPSPWEAEHVEVILDDDAPMQVGSPERTDPNDRHPESGVFHTAGRVLDSLAGEAAAGDWVLEVTNESWGDQLCYYGAALDIETVDPIAAPAITGKALQFGSVGAPYTDQLPPTSAGPIGTYAVVNPADLPPGLELVATTGEVRGTPSKKGDYSFEVTATGPGGTSAPATFSVAIGTGLPATLSITPGVAKVDQGGSIQFTVTAVDLEGNAVDIAGQYELTSSVSSDEVDGDLVRFPHASPHTITATHLTTGLTAASQIEVVAAADPTPTDPPTPNAESSKSSELANAGGPRLEMALSALALITLGGAVLLLGLNKRIN